MQREDDTPMEIGQALTLLEAHQSQASEPSPAITQGQLPHRALQVLPAAFQPRALGDQAVSPAHVEQLSRVLSRRGDKALDPIVVFWSGQAWFVIDGHHRLAAYRSAPAWVGASVPVERFSGDARSAIAEAVERNSKTIMPLLKTEKSEVGWQLVCLTHLKVKEVMAKADLSSGTVKKMRSRLRQVLEAFPDRYTAEELASYPWRDVLKPSFGEPQVDVEIDEEWEERLAHEFRDRLRKEFGDKLTKCPDAFAMAIRLLHEGLPAMLMESNEWGDQRDDRLDDWIADRDERNSYDL